MMQYEWLKTKWLCVLLCCCVAVPIYGRSQLVIPTTELQGKKGQELFEILRKWHEDAYRTNAELIYPENMMLEIEIPVGAKSILLAPYTDFNGCKMVVVNNAINNFILFSMSSKKTERLVNVSCSMIN